MREPDPAAAGYVVVWLAGGPAPGRAADLGQRAHRYRQARAAASRVGQMLVAECTSCPPGQQVWQRDQAGRPLLLRPRGWYVSLSHAEALVAAALSRDGPVGVDVERLRPLADRGALARTALCAAERRAVDAMPEASRDAQLLRFWTRKEAVAKALGTGIAIDLRAIVTTVGGTVVSLPEECGDTAAWSVADLPGPDGPDGSVAAVAVRAAGIGVRTRAVPLPACAD